VLRGQKCKEVILTATQVLYRKRHVSL